MVTEKDGVKGLESPSFVFFPTKTGHKGEGGKSRLSLNPKRLLLASPFMGDTSWVDRWIDYIFMTNY